MAVSSFCLSDWCPMGNGLKVCFPGIYHTILSSEKFSAANVWKSILEKERTTGAAGGSRFQTTNPSFSFSHSDSTSLGVIRLWLESRLHKVHELELTRTLASYSSGSRVHLQQKITAKYEYMNAKHHSYVSAGTNLLAVWRLDHIETRAPRRK